MRLPMSSSTKASRQPIHHNNHHHHHHHLAGDLVEAEEQDGGDLIIDESIRGVQGEISPTETTPPSSTTTYSSTPTLAPTTPSPYSEGEGLVIRPNSNNSTTTPLLASSSSYEQLGHSFSRPSPSALSLLANSRRHGGGNSPRYNSHPYLRRSSSEESNGNNNTKEEDSFISSYSGGNPSDSVVHSNGIWTPSYVAVNNYENYNSPPPQQQLHNEQQQIVPTSSSAMGRGGSSSSAGGGGSGFHYDIPTNGNSNGFHPIQNNTLQHQYKIEADNSSSPTRPSPYAQVVGEDGESPTSPEGHIKNSFFTQEKVDTLCDVMLRDRKRNYEMLASFLRNLTKNIHDSENVLRARAAMAYYNGDFERLYAILGCRMYSYEHHLELQHLYRNARYAEEEKKRGKPLGAVDKYRNRKKYPLPATVWDGDPTSYTFKEKDRKILIESYDRCDYPNAETKKELQLITGLTKKQIDNWFKNRRQRENKLLIESYNKCPYPSDETIKELQLHTGLKKEKIEIWFVQRRQRDVKNKGHIKHAPRRPNPNKDGILVMTPASSAGSGGSSSLIYSNMPYHENSSMDMKYSTYNNHPAITPTPTLAQVKSYNNYHQTLVNNHDDISVAHSPSLLALPPPLLPLQKNKAGGGRGGGRGRGGGGRRGRGPAKTNGYVAKQGAAAAMAGKRKRGKAVAEAIVAQISNGDDHNASVYSNYADVYTKNSSKGTHSSSGIEDDNDDISLHFHQQPPQSGYSSHHAAASVGVAAMAGWGWPSSSGSDGSHPHNHHQAYSPLNMNMLPSLAASFNYHHSHHHVINALNPEARIQVQ